MKKTHFILFVLGFLPSLLGCGSDMGLGSLVSGTKDAKVPNPNSSSLPEIAFQTLARDVAAPYSEGELKVILDNEVSFRAAWEETLSHRNPLPELPTINFEKEMVLLIKLGGGFALRDVEIKKISVDGNKLVVLAQETSRCLPKSVCPSELYEKGYCPIADPYSNPYHFVRLEKKSLPVVFKIEETRENCRTSGCDPIPFETLIAGTQAPQSKLAGSFHVFKDQKSYDEAWGIFFDLGSLPPYVDPMPPPPVDFEKQMVLLASLGLKPTGGFKIEIQKVEKCEDKIKIPVKKTTPGADCVVTQAVTHPYQFVVLEKSDLPIKFQEEIFETICEETYPEDFDPPAPPELTEPSAVIGVRG